MAEKKVFAAIELIEAQIEATHFRRQQQQEKCLIEYLQAREPYLERRYELVTGRSEPTEDELQGFQPRGAAAAAEAAAGSGGPAGSKGGSAAASGGKGASGAGRGVPFFWLNALCNQPDLAPLITPRDRCALEYLEDVRYLRGPAGSQIEFHFAPSNPYFTNRVLRKGIYVKRSAVPPSAGPGGSQEQGRGGGGGGPLPAGPPTLGGIEEVREEATVIDWRPGRSLLVRVEQPRQQQPAKGRGKQGGGGGAAEKQAGGGGCKKGKKGKKGTGGEAGPAVGSGGGGGVVSRSRRHHGKHSGPAPDLPDPEEEEEEEEREREEEEEGDDEYVKGEQDEEEEEVAGRGSRRRPCPSFFRFFMPIAGGKHSRTQELDPTVEGGDQEDSQEEEDEDEGADEEGEQHHSRQGQGRASFSRRQQRVAADGEVLNVLIKRVVPSAVHLYLAQHGKARKGAPPPGPGPEGGVTEEEDEEEGYQLITGSPAGDVASLALGAQRALHALEGLQRRLDELAAGLKAAEWAAQVEQAQEVARLGAQRRTLLVGPAGATTGQLSIPAFWLRALRATDVGSSAVQHRDERALAALADVQLLWDSGHMPSAEDPTRCAVLELEFLPNPYFSNKVLRKRFTFACPGGSLNRLRVQSAQADPIEWHPGRDLTVRAAAPEHPAHGEGPTPGGATHGARTPSRQVPSFFAFFSSTPGALCRAFNIPGQSRAAQAEALQAQEEFMGEVINVLIQFPGRLAAAAKVDVSDLGDEREDDEVDSEESEEAEEDEEEEDEDGDGEEAAARRSARRAAARAAAAAARAGRRKARGTGADGDTGGGGGGVWGFLVGLATGGGGGGGRRGGVVLMVFVAIMFLAQVLVFLDTLEYVRGKARV